ncbi:MAG: hypothetical protein AB8C84_00250 [Oligoflexales bacterium]
MIRKISFIIIALALSHSPSLQSSPQEQDILHSSPLFRLRDFSTTWLGSLGFDILGTTKLKVRTSLTVRWTRIDTLSNH